jgi:hypothetical protein
MDSVGSGEKDRILRSLYALACYVLPEASMKDSRRLLMPMIWLQYGNFHVADVHSQTKDDDPTLQQSNIVKI